MGCASKMCMFGVVLLKSAFFVMCVCVKKRERKQIYCMCSQEASYIYILPLIQDHIKLGACELFVVIGFPKTRATGNPSSAKHQHERFLSELAKNHPLYDQLRPSGSMRAQTAVLLLFQEFTDFLPEVSQAQALAASFGKVKDGLWLYTFYFSLTEPICVMS